MFRRHAGLTTPFIVAAATAKQSSILGTTRGVGTVPPPPSQEQTTETLESSSGGVATTSVGASSTAVQNLKEGSSAVASSMSPPLAPPQPRHADLQGRTYKPLTSNEPYIPNAVRELPSFVSSGNAASANTAAATDHDSVLSEAEWAEHVGMAGSGGGRSAARAHPFLERPASSAAYMRRHVEAQDRRSAARRQQLHAALAGQESSAVALEGKGPASALSSSLNPSRASSSALAEQVVLNAMREDDVRASTVDAPIDPRGRLHTANATFVRERLLGHEQATLTFRSSVGGVVGGQDAAAALSSRFQLDKGVAEALVEERQRAALGTGTLAAREGLRKARLAEHAFEMSLQPLERKQYREERRRINAEVALAERAEGDVNDALMAAPSSAVGGVEAADDIISPVRARRQFPIQREVPKLWQTKIVGQEFEDALVSYDPVPNNTPVPKAPMWTSSLSVPMRARRFIPDTWRDPQISSGLLSEEKAAAFQAWCKKACPQLAADAVFEKNITVRPRAMYTKGLYARRAFAKGEVIATIPLSTRGGGSKPSQRPTAANAAAAAPIHGVEEAAAAAAGGAGSSSIRSTSSPPSYTGDASNASTTGRLHYEMALTMESLLLHSKAVREREVPSYAAMHPLFAKPNSSLEVAAHPLFTEQLYLALLVACERAAGDESPFAPYFATIAEQAVPDDHVKEVHREAVEPHQYYEYDDHVRRFESLLRKAQQAWPKAPHHDTLVWALRFVLSRQRMTPVRTEAVDGAAIRDVWAWREDKDLDWFARLVKQVRVALFRAVLPAAQVASAERVQQAEAVAMPTVVPLVDMLHHDQTGVGTVVLEHVRDGAVVDRSASFGAEVDGSALHCGAPGGQAADVTVVLRANRDIAAGEELTTVYPRCYSVSYTLYKYGFLAYRPAADDAALAARQHGGIHPRVIPRFQLLHRARNFFSGLPRDGNSTLMENTATQHDDGPSPALEADVDELIVGHQPLPEGGVATTYAQDMKAGPRHQTPPASAASSP